MDFVVLRRDCLLLFYLCVSSLNWNLDSRCINISCLPTAMQMSRTPLPNY